MSEFPNTPVFTSGMDLYRTTSPLIESPFPSTARDTQENFFASADSKRIAGMDFIAENNVPPQLVRDMIAFVDRNANQILDPEERILFRYTVKVFISRDDSYLKQVFNKTEPSHDEVCIFLEDNSTDFFSNKKAYIKIGSDFRNDLFKRKTIAAIEAKHLRHLDFIPQQKESHHTLDFMAEEISKLIRTGQLVNQTQAFLLGFLEVLSISNILLAPFCSAVGKGMLFLTKTARQYIKFKDQHWDPNAVNSQTSEEENQSFRPFFFGAIIDEVRGISAFNEQLVEKYSAIIKKGLVRQRAQFYQQINAISVSGLAGGYRIPAGITKFLTESFNMVDVIVDALIVRSELMLTQFINLGERWLNAVNAFYCGLWNGLTEVVLGLVDLVGYFFVVLGAAGDFSAHAKTYVPEALELLDETIQTILSADIPGILAVMMDAIGEALSHFNLWALTDSITLERVAYFTGGLAGFIVEILIGNFWSGGLKTVRAAATNFGKLGDEVYEFLIKGMQSSLATAFRFNIPDMMALVRKILALLRQGKEAVRSLIRSVFNVMEKAAALTDEVVQEIMRLLKLTDEEKKYIDALGLQFVKRRGNVSSLCQITN